MNDIVYIWVAMGILFLLIEMFTATFYGLAVSVAGFLVAGYVVFSWESSITIVQVAILAIISGLLSFFFPRYLRSHKPGMKTGLDQYVGNGYPLEKIGNDWKLKIEGVDYLIDDDCVKDDFASGKKVKITGVNGGVFRVE